MTAKVSTDIVTRLRGYREEYDNGTFCWSEPVPWMKEAADEIEALRAVVRTLSPEIYTSEITQPTLDFEPARMQVTPEELEAVRRALAGDIGRGSDDA